MRSLSLFAILFASPAFADEPTETRPQALLGVLGDVLPDAAGFKITDIIDDGPASKLTRPGMPNVRGVLRQGDVVRRIDGKKFRTWRQWYDRLNAAVLAGQGDVKFTVRRADGTEGDWLAKPVISEVAVPIEPVPLISIPDIDDLPAGPIAKLEPRTWKIDGALAALDKRTTGMEPKDVAELESLHVDVLKTQSAAQSELDARAKALNDEIRKARADRAVYAEALAGYRARGDAIEVKAQALDKALVAIEQRVKATGARLDKADLVGTWKGQTTQGEMKVAVTVVFAADGSVTNTAANGLSGKGTWTRTGERVAISWSTGIAVTWTLKDGKISAGGTNPRGEKWAVEFKRE